MNPNKLENEPATGLTCDLVFTGNLQLSKSDNVKKKNTPRLDRSAGLAFHSILPLDIETGKMMKPNFSQRMIFHGIFHGLGKTCCWLLALGWTQTVGLSTSSAQEYKTHNGFTQLQAEYGGSLATGSGLSVLQVEAENSTTGAYMPNTGNAQFSGKTFTNGTVPPNTGSLSHATTVGTYFYGNSTGMATGISDITVASATDFINRYTGISTGGNPLASSFHISNHSYIGSVTPTNPVSVKLNLLRRFDFIINRDNTLAVVGANNGSGTSTPEIWAHSFNAITVGLSNGNHSRGLTTDYGAGRYAPDIVVRMADDLSNANSNNRTSWATPVVSSAAGILIDRAGFDGNGNANNGGRNEVVRSLLYAGATKENLPGWNWNKTETRPVDEVYGFGQLNVYNSYKMLEAGEFNGSTSEPDSLIAETGWDWANFDGTNDLYYSFEVAAGQTITELSAALVWNVDVFDTDSNPNSFVPDHSLSNLDLRLYNSTGDFLGSLLQSSLSTNYNYEHIYWTMADGGLSEGIYTFRISGDSAVNYGFAWRMTAVPEPSGALLTFSIGIIAFLKRRRLAQA